MVETESAADNRGPLSAPSPIAGFAQPVIGSSDLTTWATTTATSYWPKTTSSDAKYRAFGPVGGPLSFSSASFALEVLPTLNSRTNLQLDTTQAINGSATIEVHYL